MKSELRPVSYTLYNFLKLYLVAHIRNEAVSGIFQEERWRVWQITNVSSTTFSVKEWELAGILNRYHFLLICQISVAHTPLQRTIWMKHTSVKRKQRFVWNMHSCFIFFLILYRTGDLASQYGDSVYKHQFSLTNQALELFLSLVSLSSWVNCSRCVLYCFLSHHCSLWDKIY